MSLSLGIRTRYCAVICHSQTFYTQGLERQRSRQLDKTFTSFRKRREILFRLETQTLTKKVFLWDRSSVMLRKLHKTLLNFFFSSTQNKIRRVCMEFSEYNLLTSQRQFSPKCLFLVNRPLRTLFFLIEYPDKSHNFRNFIFMTSSL